MKKVALIKNRMINFIKYDRIRAMDLWFFIQFFNFFSYTSAAIFNKTQRLPLTYMKAIH